MGDEGGYGGYGDSYGGNSYNDNNGYTNSYNNYNDNTNDYNNSYNNNDTKSSSYEPTKSSSYEPPKSSYDDKKSSYDDTSKQYNSYNSASLNNYNENNFNNDTKIPEHNTIIPDPIIIINDNNTKFNESQNDHYKTDLKEPTTNNHHHVDHNHIGTIKKDDVEDKKENDAEAADEDDDDKRFQEYPSENITVTTAEINTPPDKTKSDHKALALLIGTAVAADKSNSEEELEKIGNRAQSLHANCCKKDKDNDDKDDHINLDDKGDASKDTDPLQSEAGDSHDGKKKEENECLLDCLSFCITCCECVIS